LLHSSSSTTRTHPRTCQSACPHLTFTCLSRALPATFLLPSFPINTPEPTLLPHDCHQLHSPAAHDTPAKCPLLTTSRLSLITSIHPPHPMYANAAIQFRDPFAARDSTINRQPHNYAASRANWASYTPSQDLSRALTPPPDMNTVGHVAQHVTHHEQRYNSHMPAHSAYRAPVAQYPPYEPSGESRTADSRDAKVSPTSQARLPALDSAIETQSRQHKPNHNAIAPSFQIPKSVNDSGGSLSELAAEVSLFIPNNMTIYLLTNI
jgi:hypothetical protein